MNTYHFTEATPLLKFIDENKENIIGCTLCYFHAEYWPCHGRSDISDIPIILELTDYCIAIEYVIYSSIWITIGTRDELKENHDIGCVIDLRNRIQDYYCEEFEEGICKELIENCKIVDIQIERFSDAFECNTNGDIRPAGGDYFSTIRITLDSGVVLCLCGVDSVTDGYVEVWYE